MTVLIAAELIVALFPRLSFFNIISTLYYRSIQSGNEATFEVPFISAMITAKLYYRSFHSNVNVVRLLVP